MKKNRWIFRITLAIAGVILLLLSSGCKQQKKAVRYGVAYSEYKKPL